MHLYYSCNGGCDGREPGISRGLPDHLNPNDIIQFIRQEFSLQQLEHVLANMSGSNTDYNTENDVLFATNDMARLLFISILITTIVILIGILIYQNKENKWLTRRRRSTVSHSTNLKLI